MDQPQVQTQSQIQTQPPPPQLVKQESKTIGQRLEERKAKQANMMQCKYLPDPKKDRKGYLDAIKKRRDEKLKEIEEKKKIRALEREKRHKEREEKRAAMMKKWVNDYIIYLQL